jgi:large subunit ribosomal protein L21
VYAIVKSGGRQHKVAVGDVVEVDRIVGKPGTPVEFKTLLVVDGDLVTSDAWVLEGVKVSGEIVAEIKAPKIDILKYKNKTGYRVRQGHRQKYTQVKVTSIDTGKK